MMMNMFRFVDPTGAGDDILVIAPEWVEVPGVFQVRDSEGEPYEFQGTVEDEGTFESGDTVSFP